jgi:hypothetical protein
MVQYTAMSTSARAQVISSVETDDPEVMARQRHLVQLLLAKHPELEQDLQKRGRSEGRKQGRREGRRKGQLAEARVVLRRVLTRRGFELTADEEARIDAWATLAMLETSPARQPPRPQGQGGERGHIAERAGRG